MCDLVHDLFSTVRYSSSQLLPKLVTLIPCFNAYNLCINASVWFLFLVLKARGELEDPIPTAHGSINRLAGEALAGNGKYLTFLRLTFDKEKSIALKKSS